ncbi:MAG TPA: AI-2E family transporter [Planctomycetota bacterium]|nr:AI-2E family transporter [Planctomycetota bacterium]
MSDPESPAPPPVPATPSQKAAWIILAAGLWFCLQYGLLPALLAGLLVHSLIQRLARGISGSSVSHHRAKLLSLALVAGVGVATATALVFLLAAFLRGHVGNLPDLIKQMADNLESLRHRMGWGSWFPAAEGLKDTLVKTLREHARELQHVGGELGRVLVHALAGSVVGALVSFETERPRGPLSGALTEQVARLSAAFEKVVFAQIRISALNALFTAVFLLVALPSFGVVLPLHKTLVILTFVVGLIPVLGNLISNTAIVVIALGTSFGAAVAALVFLIVIHKLEYFLNAKIVGSHIHAKAWEILLAIICFEASFGLAGVILAPIAYAYFKRELADRGLL